MEQDVSREELQEYLKQTSIEPLAFANDGKITVAERVRFLLQWAQNRDEAMRLIRLEEHNQKIGKEMGFEEKSDYDLIFLLFDLGTDEEDSGWLPLRDEIFELCEELIDNLTRLPSKKMYHNFGLVCLFLSGGMARKGDHTLYPSLCRNIFSMAMENEVGFRRLEEMLKDVYTLVANENYTQLINFIQNSGYME